MGVEWHRILGCGSFRLGHFRAYFSGQVDTFETFGDSEALRLGIAPHDRAIAQKVDCKDGSRVEEKDMESDS